MHLGNDMDVINVGNVVNVFEGFQSLPTNLGSYGFEVKMTGSEGHISSPGYGKEACTELQYVHYILEFPDNMMDLMGGTGSLKVEFEANMGGQTLEYM